MRAVGQGRFERPHRWRARASSPCAWCPRPAPAVRRCFPIRSAPVRNRPRRAGRLVKGRHAEVLLRRGVVSQDRGDLSGTGPRPDHVDLVRCPTAEGARERAVGGRARRRRRGAWTSRNTSRPAKPDRGAGLQHVGNHYLTVPTRYRAKLTSGLLGRSRWKCRRIGIRWPAQGPASVAELWADIRSAQRSARNGDHPRVARDGAVLRYVRFLIGTFKGRRRAWPRSTRFPTARKENCPA